MRRRWALMIAVALSATGCSGGSRAVSRPAAVPAGDTNRPVAVAPSGEVAVLQGADGARAVELATGRTVAEVGRALAVDGGATLVGSSAAGELVVADARSGATRSIPGQRGLVPTAVSTDGRLVALAERRPPAPSGYLAAGATRSVVAVAPTSGKGAPRAFTLAGNYVPEAFSADGSQVFLVEYLPASAPDHYRVRQLDLATGAVAGVLGPRKQPLDEQMAGVGRMHVLDADRAVLYTLYRTVGSGRAFVHTLHLDEQWAHCIVLPEPLGLGGDATAIALGPDGTLYAWDAAAGVLAVVDGTDMSVRRTVAVGSATPADASPTGAVPTAAVAVAGDGSVVLVDGDLVRELAPRTLAETSAWRLPAAASSIAVTADGRRLVALTGDRVVVLDRADHRVLTSLPAPATQQIAAVLAPT